MNPRHLDRSRMPLVWRALLLVLIAALLSPTVASASAPGEVPPPASTGADPDEYAQVGRRLEAPAQVAVIAPATPLVHDDDGRSSLQPVPETVWEPEDDDGRAPPGTRGPPGR